MRTKFNIHVFITKEVSLACRRDIWKFTNFTIIHNTESRIFLPHISFAILKDFTTKFPFKNRIKYTHR